MLLQLRKLLLKLQESYCCIIKSCCCSFISCCCSFISYCCKLRVVVAAIVVAAKSFVAAFRAIVAVSKAVVAAFDEHFWLLLGKINIYSISPIFTLASLEDFICTVHLYLVLIHRDLFLFWYLLCEGFTADQGRLHLCSSRCFNRCKDNWNLTGLMIGWNHFHLKSITDIKYSI